ncbi:MAG: glycosyltransferase family 4 protein, partial [Planctomycetes bacterium]|nr:glycosyltransferase family 4 protein [Planctomycetota bacterium]
EYDLYTHALPKPKFFRDSDLTSLKWNELWAPIIAKEISSFQPDLVLSQNMLVPSTVAAAREAGVPSTIFFHGYKPISPTFFAGENALEAEAPSFSNLPLRFKLKWPWVKKNLAAYKEAYSQATQVIANSDYIAKVIERFFGRPAAVLYPIIDMENSPAARLEETPEPTPEGPILFIKPQAIKGIEVLIRTAPLLPEKKFVVTGTARKGLTRRLEALPNVTCIPWCSDIDRLYREASLLFAPAQIPEPFGRVFVEAGLHGVTSVASEAGGIPEAAGDGALYANMKEKPEKWAELIRTATAPENYPALRAKALTHARDITHTHTAEHLNHLVTSNCTA